MQAGKGQHKHRHIRQDEPGVILLIGNGLGILVDQHINQHCDQRGRYGNPDIDLEFVTQLYFLAAGGGNGGVRNHRQVIAKHGTANHRTNGIHRGNLRGFGKTKGNGCTGCNGAH